MGLAEDKASYILSNNPLYTQTLFSHHLFRNSILWQELLSVKIGSKYISKLSMRKNYCVCEIRGNPPKYLHSWKIKVLHFIHAHKKKQRIEIKIQTVKKDQPLFQNRNQGQSVLCNLTQKIASPGVIHIVCLACVTLCRLH